MPESDEIHSHYDRRRKGLVADLTAEDAQQIAEGFVAEPSTDPTLVMVLSVLASYHSAEFDLAALRATDAAFEGTPPWWGLELVPLEAARAGVSNFDQLLKADLSEIDFDQRPEAARAWWEACRATIRAKREPHSIVPSKTGRVGGNTPD